MMTNLRLLFLLVGYSSALAFTRIPRGGSTGPSIATATESCSSVDADADDDDDQLLAAELLRCDNEIVDPHLHTAPWFDNADTLIQELEANNVSIGLLYNPYPKQELPFDMNTYIHSIVSASNKKIFMLASLNTTHEDWEKHREFEINRLETFLEKEGVVGAKLAPPHTCLPLTGPRMDDVVETVSRSSKKLLAIHIGTTPFCGALGKQFGIDCRCSPEYVDPTLLIPKVEQYPQVKFVLLHSGHEFLPTDSPDFYKFVNVDKCIAMAKKYPNVYLSISAIFAQSPEGVMKYPGGDNVVQKIKDAGVQQKVFWGSDASYQRGQIRPVLISAIKAMIKAGWTEEERTWALRGCAKELFQLPS
mmetsp:Transcript_9000/g.20301  ORF Transcript_9000/g.20301 Transcript_9000/m.20301 type:complete len:361 (+) Transcript_9000:3-1085(+)